MNTSTQGIGDYASADQVMTILNTIYFYDEWQDKFDAEKTKADEFHLKNGETITSDFMNMANISKSFSKGKNYISSSLAFKNQCSMVFILPDEGVSPHDIINDTDTLQEAINYLGTPNENFGNVTFKIPKFNFSNNLDLKDSLKALGIEEVFDDSEADFSPLTENSDLSVSTVKQSASISIDEIGCEASAFTQIDLWGSGLVTEKADMILNRPFIFAITDYNGTPLFIGVINNPQL